MNRIDFLKQLLFGGALLFVPKPSLENVSKEPKEIRLSSPYIAGFQYYQGVDVEQMLKENDCLILKRESQNVHDCYAIEVFSSSNKLGYLPREENKVIARIMDQGITVKGRIVQVNPEAYLSRKIKMKVYYEAV